MNETLHKSGEDYLEAILVLKQRKGVVRSIDVAHHLEYSKPSVSRAVSNLKRDGYLLMQEDGELQLTEKGLQIAENIYERHTVITSLLVGLGVSEETAAEDACRVEHAISEESFGCIKAAYQRGLQEQQEAASADDKDDKKKKKKKKK